MSHSMAARETSMDSLSPAVEASLLTRSSVLVFILPRSMVVLLLAEEEEGKM